MKKFFALIIIIWLVIPLTAQVVFEPLDHEVYDFLDILGQKGIIELNDLIKPLSRKYIFEKLREADKAEDKLTSLEKQELKYYEKEYFFEDKLDGDTTQYKKSPNFLGRDEAGRFRLFSYGNPTFKIAVSPIIGYQLTFPKNERNVNSWDGFYAYGYLSDFLGYSMDVRGHNESGSYVDPFKYFTTEEGIIPSDKYDLNIHENSFDYSEVKGMVSAGWSWGDVVFAKDFITYGYAQSGNLVLSDKAQSFPYIRVDLHPISWLKFYYFHAFLASDVIDSVNYNAGMRDIYRNKYFAWHSLVVTPAKGLDLSIGESVVYADRLEPLYLMPFMFYFLADDFISNRIEGRVGDANSQIFLSISSRDHVKNTHLYGTIFIDELTLAGLTGSVLSSNKTTGTVFGSSRDRTQLGFTLGASITDLPIDNLTLTTEYTRINPYVYEHHDPAQTYTNAGYLLGDWIGPNADLAYLDLNYRILRGLQIDLWGEYIRKGSENDSLQYADVQPPFLYGLDSHYTYLGMNLKYEPIHELNITAGFRSNLNADEQDDGSYLSTRTNIFSFSIYYGM
jgi:hypothetical protein